MLKSEPLSFSYDGKRYLQFPALECRAGEQCLLLGQSGCGKTTLLHLLGGLLTPNQGNIQIGDTVLNNLSGAALDQFRGKNIGIIFQQSHFIKALTVEQNLELAQSLSNSPRDNDLIKYVLDRLNILQKLNDKPDELSQDEQQRVAIARALVIQPKVILADEPTSALDDVNCDEVISLLEAQAKEANAALLIVTHDSRLKDHIEQQVHLELQV